MNSVRSLIKEITDQKNIENVFPTKVGVDISLGFLLVLYKNCTYQSQILIYFVFNFCY